MAHLSTNHLTVSCYYGEANVKVHPAPKGSKAIFFSNNKSIHEEAINKGWDFILHDKQDFTLSSDRRISSLQAKYVKFFQFRNDYPELRQFRRISYCDHKVHLQDWRNVWMMTRIRPESLVMIRYSPTRKDINDEIRAANRQERYAKTMPETIKWLEEVYLKRGLSSRNRVMNTGIMYVQDVASTMKLFNEIYDVIKELEQPECQIIWAALNQGWLDKIDPIEWHDIDIPWIEPK